MARIVYGIRPVAELLSYPDRVIKLLQLEDARSQAIMELTDLAINNGINVETVSRKILDSITKEGAHQGIVAKANDFPYVTLETLLETKAKPGVPRRLILACDEITDPQNFGAMARSMEALGGVGVVIMSRRSVEVTHAVCKTSAGAVEHLPIAQVVNLSNALDRAKKRGWMVVGLDMDGDLSAYDKLDAPDVVLVVGSEGKGIRRLVAENCDRIMSIPMRGRVSSLNASVSVGIAISRLLS